MEDEASQPTPEQMRRSAFLDELQAAVCAAADAELSNVGRTAQGCPYIEHWIAYYRTRSSQYIERALLRYAPEAAEARGARDYVSVVAERVRRAVAVWATTGEVTGVPEEVAGQVPEAGSPGAAGVSPAGAGGAVAGTVRVAGRVPGGVLAKAREGGARGGGNPQQIQAELGPGQPLASGVGSSMGSAFGYDFSRVRVHTDAKAGALSNSLNARAFTLGDHVAFGAGEYRPGTMIGDALIAHELAHVAQQRGAASPAAPPVLDSGHGDLEEEADNSAVGAVFSIWGKTKGALARISRNAMPRLKSGLRLQRCKKGGAQGNISSASVSGGVTGLTMNVTATYSDCSACQDGLEAIQVVWATGGPSGVQVGTYQTKFPPLAATYDSFVDGGKNSPGGAVYTGDHPYYIGRSDLPASYGYVGGQGSAGSVSGCTINPQDTPNAVLSYQEAFFETVFACLNYQGTKKDKLLEAFKWGFVSKGTSFQASPTSAAGGSVEHTSSHSAKFEETLAADYPGYSHT